MLKKDVQSSAITPVLQYSITPEAIANASLLDDLCFLGIVAAIISDGIDNAGG